MSCDQSRINTIENNLQQNPSSISDTDLIYYLQCKSNNKILDSSNLTATQDYLKNINNSFFFENIFINTSNYTGIIPILIGLLLPFYYMYPRFYKLGFWGAAIGIISFCALYSKINGLYSNFIDKVGIYFLGVTISIYIIFFIVTTTRTTTTIFRFTTKIIKYIIISKFIMLYNYRLNIYIIICFNHSLNYWFIVVLLCKYNYRIRTIRIIRTI